MQFFSLTKSGNFSTLEIVVAFHQPFFLSNLTKVLKVDRAILRLNQQTGSGKVYSGFGI